MLIFLKYSEANINFVFHSEFSWQAPLNELEGNGTEITYFVMTFPGPIFLLGERWEKKRFYCYYSCRPIWFFNGLS